MLNSNRYALLLTFLLIVALDQFTKLEVVQLLSVGELIPVIPGFFNITLTYNPGAAFGLLAGVEQPWRMILLAATTCLALGAVGYFMLVEYKHDRVARLALAAILGGAVGNIIDRVRLGVVIDFLDVYYGTYHWPAFNIADSAICVGVGVLLLRSPRRKELEPETGIKSE